MQFDKELCRQICTAVEESAQQVAAKHGVHIRRGNARFPSTNITLKLEISVISDEGDVLDRERAAFIANAMWLGLSPQDLGKTINYAGAKYTIIGLKERSTKYPILCKNENDGRTYKLPAEVVVNALGKRELYDR